MKSTASEPGLRKQPLFGDATTGFPTKLRLRNERRNSILMTRHYPDLGSDAKRRPNVGCFLRLDFPEIIYSQSIKIAKSDLNDIDCIDQSVEIDDTLVSFIDLQYLDFTDSINLYRKIHLSFCSSKNEN